MIKNKIGFVQTDSIETVLCAGPALRALKEKNKDVEFVLISERNFEPSAGITGVFDSFRVLADVNQDEYSEIYNLNTIDTDFSNQGQSPWKTYFASLAKSSQINPFHTIDILKKAFNAESEVIFQLQGSTERAFEALELAQKAAGEKIRIVLDLDRIPVEAVESLASTLCRLKFATEIFICGSLACRPAAEAAQSVNANSVPIHNLCGKLSYAQIAALVETCDLVVSAPGITSILSSGYGTINFCFDYESGEKLHHYPYGHGHFVFSNPNTKDSNASASALLAELIEHIVLGRSGATPDPQEWEQFIAERLTVYLNKTKLAITQKVETKYQDGTVISEQTLKPLIFMGAEPQDIYRVFYNLIWEYRLNGRVLRVDDFTAIHTDSPKHIISLLKPLEQLCELANFGGIYSSQIRAALGKQQLDKAKADSDKLQEVEQLISTISVTYPELAPFCVFHNLSQAALNTNDPVKLSEEMTTSFNELKESVLVLLDLKRSLFHTVLEGTSPGSSSNV